MAINRSYLFLIFFLVLHVFTFQNSYSQDYSRLVAIDSALFKAHVSSVIHKLSYAQADELRGKQELTSFNKDGQETEYRTSQEESHYFYANGQRVKTETTVKYPHGNDGQVPQKQLVVETYSYNAAKDTITGMSISADALQDTFRLMVVLNKAQKVIEEGLYVNAALSTKTHRDYDSQNRLVAKLDYYYSVQGEVKQVKKEITVYDANGLAYTTQVEDTSYGKVKTHTIKCTLDKYGKLLTKNVDDKTFTTYTYNSNGLIKQSVAKEKGEVVYTNDYTYTYY